MKTLALLFLFTATWLTAADWPEKGAREYWNQGKAEITHYALEQNRYGDLHKGDAVLIFVSEPFSRSKQVKLDDYAAAGDDLVNVLKLNFTKKFLTGIYPYSLMLSTFTPADGEAHTLKATMSGQEWCGHVYSQMNLRDGKYSVKNFSYFESEGDTEQQLEGVLLEDEIWAKIRLSPTTLPTGKIPMIPGLFFARLTHTPQKVEEAQAALTDHSYTITYPTSNRQLTIEFEAKAPHQITGWEETYTDFSGKRLTTTAKLTKTLLTDYWNRHNNGDRKLRKQLDLSTEY